MVVIGQERAEREREGERAQRDLPQQHHHLHFPSQVVLPLAVSAVSAASPADFQLTACCLLAASLLLLLPLPPAASVVVMEGCGDQSWHYVFVFASFADRVVLSGREFP